MKDRLIFTITFLFLLIPLATAANDFAYNRLYDGTQLIDGLNYSINVNHSLTSDYATNAGDSLLFDGYSSTGYRSWLEIYFDTIYAPLSALADYLPLSGGTMSGGIDMGGENIENVGSLNVSGDLDVAGNVTASYFIGDGSQLTGIQDNDNDTHVAGDGIYLYNDSTTMFFNETKLNLTIEALDNDTIYTAGDGIIIVNNIINSTLGTSIDNSEIENDAINTTQIIDETITDADINNSINLTLGQKITFAFGEIIDNIVDGWISITGSLDVSGD